MSRPPARRLAALALGLGGLVALGVLVAHEQRTGATPTAPPLDLGAVAPATLDTVAFRGRRIDASLGGWVSDVGPDGRVWLGSDARAFPVVLPDSAEPRVEDRLLVWGRLRGRGGQRWLEARAWTPVQSMAE